MTEETGSGVGFSVSLPLSVWLAMLVLATVIAVLAVRLDRRG